MKNRLLVSCTDNKKPLKNLLDKGFLLQRGNASANNGGSAEIELKMRFYN